MGVGSVNGNGDEWACIPWLNRFDACASSPSSVHPNTPCKPFISAPKHPLQALQALPADEASALDVQECNRT